jgi:hypothetical protein
MATIELNIDQIISEAESFGSPYDAKTEEELNIMAHNVGCVLSQLRAVKSAISADETGQYAYKAVRVSALIAYLDNKLLVIEDARGDL